MSKQEYANTCPMVPALREGETRSAESDTGKSQTKTRSRHCIGTADPTTPPGVAISIKCNTDTWYTRNALCIDRCYIADWVRMQNYEHKKVYETSRTKTEFVKVCD